MSHPAPDKLRFATIATDTALFTFHDGALFIRLIKVKRPPHYPNNPGLPGGLIDPAETAEEASVRHVARKAGIRTKQVYVEQLCAMSALTRDPRGRVIAIAYLALVPWEELSETERSDSLESWWQPVARLPHLAYDHDEIVAIARKRLASRATYTTLMRTLMPLEFTLPDLERAYGAVLGKPVDRRNFRKKLAKLDILKTLSHKKRGGAHRPAQLYRFKGKNVVEIEVI